MDRLGDGIQSAGDIQIVKRTPGVARGLGTAEIRRDQIIDFGTSMNSRL
jgi:hypothetical protein